MGMRVRFKSRWLPYALLAPQVAVTLVFFIWPATQALYQSVLAQDAFGLSTSFAGLANFRDVLSDPGYRDAFGRTFLFAISVTVIAGGSGLAMAALVDRVFKGVAGYKLLMTWPYAVAPAVAGVLWLFMFNTGSGVLTAWLAKVGYEWNHVTNGSQAMLLVIIAAAWRQIAYNFLFFLAALQAVPRALKEAAAIDGAGPFKRFWTVIFPLLSPTAFFLLIMNMVYSFFETFGIIHAVTQGGPGNATEILVYKVYRDGFEGMDFGGSAAQSVILMLLVIALTAVQFRFLERRVQY